MKKGAKKTSHSSQKNNKEYFIWSIILVILLMILVVSITYAYFSRFVTKTGSDPETNVTTGLLDIDFLTTEYINNNDATLIDDENAYIEADKTVFSVSRSDNNTTREVYYVISLVDLSISDNLKESSDFKWALYDKVGLTSNTMPIAHGDFTSADNNTMSLYSEKIELSANVIHNYSLLVWLSNDEENDQYSLLNGTFRARVEVTATNN